MEVEDLKIPAVKLVTPKRFGDNRGFFSEVYNFNVFSQYGIADRFVQDNHSLSAEVGTLRGLHFQKEPFGQVKLVRVIRGRILDVAVDLRKASSTYGTHVAVELSAENFAQLLIPVGFAHAFCTLEPDTEVIYKVSEYYSPQADAGVLWSDPELAIEWPFPADKLTLSDKDSRLPLLRDVGVVF